MIKLQNECCIEAMKEMADGSVDMVLTDPPYHSTKLHFDKAGKVDYVEYFKQVKRVLKPSGVFVSFADFNLAHKLISTGGFRTSYEIIWSKTMATGFLGANIRPLRAHEYIVVMVDGLKKATYNPQKTEGKAYERNRKEDKCGHYRTARQSTANNTGDRHPTTVVSHSNGNYRSQHPTAKPTGLCEKLILTYSNEGDTVLDTFMGAGSTGQAAINTGRNYIGIELDPGYFEIASGVLLP